MNIYEANKTMQIIGQQTPVKYMENEETKKGFMEVLQAHQEYNKNNQYDIALDMFLYGIITGKREERHKSQEKYKSKITAIAEDFIMTSEDIGSLASDWQIPADLMDTIIQDYKEASELEKQKAKAIPPMFKFIYSCERAYKLGVLEALYMFNESNKEAAEKLKKEF